MLDNHLGGLSLGKTKFTLLSLVFSCLALSFLVLGMRTYFLSKPDHRDYDFIKVWLSRSAFETILPDEQCPLFHSTLICTWEVSFLQLGNGMRSGFAWIYSDSIFLPLLDSKETEEWGRETERKGRGVREKHFLFWVNAMSIFSLWHHSAGTMVEFCSGIWGVLSAIATAMKWSPVVLQWSDRVMA